MQRAYLIGLANYPDHRLLGVPNDLRLMRRALMHQGFAPEVINIFGDEVGTLDGLYSVLARIQAEFTAAERKLESHCFFYFGGSGMLSIDPLQGGMKPLNGDDLNFSTALPFAVLNDYLPVRPGIRVTALFDC